MGYYLYTNLATIQQHEWEFDIKLLILSIGLLWFAMGSFTFMIGIIFNDLTGTKLGYFQIYRAFNIANIGRYLPGKVWSIIGLVYFTSEYGISKKQASLSILAMEVSSKVSAILLGLCYFLFSSSFENYMPIMLVFLICCLIIIHPRLLDKVINYGLRLIKKDEIKIDFGYSNIFKYLTGYLVVWLIHSLAFYVFVNSLTSLESINIIQFFTILPLCWVVGYIMIFAPGGIGVREGMLVIILGEFLPAEIALVIAVFQRIWFLIVEGINVVISFAIPVKIKKE